MPARDTGSIGDKDFPNSWSSTRDLDCSRDGQCLSWIVRSDSDIASNLDTHSLEVIGLEDEILGIERSEKVIDPCGIPRQ